MKKNILTIMAVGALLAMAFLWGSTTVVIKDTLTRMTSTDLLAYRFIIAALVLVVIFYKFLITSRKIILQSIVIGSCFGFGQILQTIGLKTTMSSISGFLTGTYVIFTPLLSAAMLGTKIKRGIWYAISLSVVGMTVLSMGPNVMKNGFGQGEILTILGALLFAAQIVFTGMFATQKNAKSLTVWQSVIVAAICLSVAIPWGIALPSSSIDWIAILYLAIGCGAATLFFQNWAQSLLDPTKAAIIMCTEPVWSALIAVSSGFEPVTINMVIGGIFILVAMLMVIVQPRKKSEESKSTSLTKANTTNQLSKAA